MKRTKKLVTLLTAIFVFTMGITSVYAQIGRPGQCPLMMSPGGDDDGPCMIMDRHLINRVGLTADQKAKIDGLISEHQKAVIKQRSEIKIMMVDLRTEMDKDAIDMAKVGELADKISKGQAELTKMRIMNAAQVESLMTKEQRTKLEQLRAERRQMMMERFKGKPERSPQKRKE
jgi:protein CpxP